MNRTTACLSAAAVFFSLGSAAQAIQAIGSSIEVRIEGLRNSRGTLRLCLNQNRAHYPDCSGDPQARKVNIPASTRSYLFANLRPGQYVITAMHDENGDGDLNTFLGIPREGFAFSNNPTVRFSAPSFDRVRFNIGPSRALVRLRFKYIG